MGRAEGRVGEGSFRSARYINQAESSWLFYFVWKQGFHMFEDILKLWPSSLYLPRLHPVKLLDFSVV